jgi:hypothetical protein
MCSVPTLVVHCTASKRTKSEQLQKVRIYVSVKYTFSTVEVLRYRKIKQKHVTTLQLLSFSLDNIRLVLYNCAGVHRYHHKLSPKLTKLCSRWYLFLVCYTPTKSSFSNARKINENNKLTFRALNLGRYRCYAKDRFIVKS